jgi:2-oxoglutarate ferredoxin oxidoreductase subunit alpha
MKFNWKIGGEAGFGIMTSGLVFSKVATRSGYYIYDYTEYPSLIRGGHNTYEVAVSDNPISASIFEVDFLICLNKETYDLHKHRLKKDAYLMYDPEQFEPDTEVVKMPVPFAKIKREQSIQQQMLNSVALAGSIYFLGGDQKIYDDMIKEQFSRKGEDVINFNLNLANIGREYVRQSGLATLKVLTLKENIEKKLVITGNEVFSLASIPADCRHYASYPMTPASSILGILAAWQYKNGMVVRHPEDEISVINSALGSSFVGARSAVGTSGGGFALMVEALSFAGVAEIPIVVFLSMRPGPATGMPTWTEQGDLLFAVNSGHGEFPKIVLAPGDVHEMASMTLKAFDLADIYQTPVILLSDKLLSESHQVILKKDIEKMFAEYIPDRGKIKDNIAEPIYLRYENSDDGVSPMLLPGKEGIYYQANSYEHIEDSHTTEDATPRKVQVEKRNRKQATYLKNHFSGPNFYGQEHPDILLVSWGSMKGVILEALRLLDSENIRVGFLHFNHIFPLSEELVSKHFSDIGAKNLILIENNSQAQFGKLLREQTGINIKDKLLRYDGRPFYPEEIRDYVKQYKK